MRRQDEVVLWPVYFDSSKTRAEGRKVAKKLGKLSPTLGMIEKAIVNLRLSYKLVPDAAYPSSPWKKTGLVLVKRVRPKYQILKEVAEELSRFPV